jgi:hypothetical protein
LRRCRSTNFRADAAAGAPQRGWNAEPRSGPVPGWAGDPQAGPPPGSGGRLGRTRTYDDSPVDSIDQAIADVALGAAARFIGRAVAKRVQRTVSERVMPAMAPMAAAREAKLRAQIAIAEQHPDIRACLKDSVIFRLAQPRAADPQHRHATTEQPGLLVTQLGQAPKSSRLSC